PYIELASRHDIQAVAIVLDVPDRVCQARNRERSDRQFGPHVVVSQGRQLRQSLRNLKREGFRHIFTLNEAQIASAQVVRVPLWTDRRGEMGPFDIIGDIHGCYDELTELLTQLGYAPETASVPSEETAELEVIGAASEMAEQPMADREKMETTA